MTKEEGADILKWYFLGQVDYAAHNFARLKPLLFSKDGRAWDGVAKREWFPTEGLVFSLSPELRFAPGKSLWTFRIKENARTSSPEKDSFSAIQIHPAIRLRTDLQPMEAETLRRLATEVGLQNSSGCVSAGLPELDSLWVIVPGLEKGEDDLWRPVQGDALRRLKVIEGEPEALCGKTTTDGFFVLPPIPSQHVAVRNWTDPKKFIAEFAGDLRRWLPHGQSKLKAQSAANSLREIGPLLTGISALRSEDAHAALLRVRSLVFDAEALTAEVERIVSALFETEPFKAGVDAERERIRIALEEEALATVEKIEGSLRDKLVAECTRLKGEITVAKATYDAIQADSITLAEEIAQTRSARAENVALLNDEIDSLLDRATTEPGRILAEWLGISGFARKYFTQEHIVETESRATAPDPFWPPAPEMEVSKLGRALFEASPEKGEARTRILEIDSAIRSRELPVLIGRQAREFAEAWLSVAGGTDPISVPADPTLLSVGELTPMGSRGKHAPLARAFERALEHPSRVVTVFLDDLDPAAASFWLPELARAIRAPTRFGFPSNLVALALLEAEADQMRLSAARVAELFPLTFEDCDPSAVAAPGTGTYELPLSSIVPAQVTTSWQGRVTAFGTAAELTFAKEDVRILQQGFGEYIQNAKTGDRITESCTAFCKRLHLAAKHLTAVKGAS